MVARPGLLRLDELLVRKGYAASREKARALVLAGAVRLPSGAAPKPGLLVGTDVPVEVAQPARYVSRGGDKLARALDVFHVDPAGRVCADFGASTGGFTDCLLQRGARRVYAVDVGYGQLHWGLRQDPRVVVLERTNARFLNALPEPVDLVTIDASFISLRLLLPAARGITTADAEIVALVKPQFEAGKGRVGKGGVVRDLAVHREVLEDLAEWLRAEGFSLVTLAVSPLRGPAGNAEFLAHIRPAVGSWCDAAEAIDQVLETVRGIGGSGEGAEPHG
ncbi:MAG: TlyA family RNA methyltransferase [Chloroflexi bacterium]|nr:TlyA family RNA methyltransferase [Chloroflexota bacterium]